MKPIHASFTSTALSTTLFLLFSFGLVAAILGLPGRGVERREGWFLSMRGVRATLRYLAAADARLLRHPRTLADTIALQAAIVLLDTATIWTLIRALGESPSIAGVFAGFMVASLFRTMGVLPGGLGTFEASSVLMLRMVGVDLAVALSATLLFRALNFWLPMLPGYWDHPLAEEDGARRRLPRRRRERCAGDARRGHQPVGRAGGRRGARGRGLRPARAGARRHSPRDRGGPRTFANTWKYILITTSANLGNMVSMAAASLFLPFLPLTAGQILLNNFISDIPALGIANDAVDPELVDRPHRWDTRFIGRYMVEFGALSAAFDVLLFVLLLTVFHTAPEAFRTGWFVESLLTELVVAMLMRTRRPFFSSRPGTMLLVTTSALIPVALAVPYLPQASLLGFTPLPGALMATIVAVTVLYAMATELQKRWFYRQERKVPDAANRSTSRPCVGRFE